MVPTKVKYLIPEVASFLGLPEEHLASMYSFYVKENKKILSGMGHLHVALRGLGTMTIKGWEIEKKIEYMQKSISMCRTNESVQEYKDNIKIFEQALPKWKEQEERKKAAKKLKQEYYKNKEKSDYDTTGKITNSLE